MKETVTKESVRKAIYRIFLETEGRILNNVPFTFDPKTGRTLKHNGELVLFDDLPLVGFSSANDPLYDSFKREGVIGPSYMKPTEWLDGAQTVISVFFPFSRQVKASNDAMEDKASSEWTYARIEGQQFILNCMKELSDYLNDYGVRNCVPVCDSRFSADSSHFTSNWSERHAAFAGGLGTFGMSRGLITKKGMAGRFAGIIIDRKLDADVREYTGVYDYCLRCGACAARCPGRAIPPDGPKLHELCYPVVLKSRNEFAPRYGCGLCQTNVPCENCIPVHN